MYVKQIPSRAEPAALPYECFRCGSDILAKGKDLSFQLALGNEHWGNIFYMKPGKNIALNKQTDLHIIFMEVTAPLSSAAGKCTESNPGEEVKTGSAQYPLSLQPDEL